MCLAHVPLAPPLHNARYPHAQISFGGLIGKVNPTQLVVLVVFESIFYCFNKQYLMIQWLALADVGGTIIIHMFGAYFGLSVAYVLGVPKNTSMEKASVTSDVFSLIGTTFLWLYWPSFVAGEIEPGTAEAELAITQTILSLLVRTPLTRLYVWGPSQCAPSTSALSRASRSTAKSTCNHA
jgi:ammonium transporter Rh